MLDETSKVLDKTLTNHYFARCDVPGGDESVSSFDSRVLDKGQFDNPSSLYSSSNIEVNEETDMNLVMQNFANECDSLSKAEEVAQVKVKALKQQQMANGAVPKKVVGERDARAKEKGEAQQAVEELKKQLEAKGAELQKVASDRDARAKEKGEAQQALEELKKQLEAKEGELQKVVGDRDARSKEKGEAQQQVSELMQQLERERKQLKTQASALLLSQKTLKTKESELQELQGDFHMMRLRHLRQRSR